jgi:imidazolonepropionase-like amidohydrolase
MAAGLDVPAMTTTTVTGRRRLTALRAAWLFDGTSATLRANPVIILDGSAIAAVGYDIAPPQQADLVDLDGATLLPGLIDTHVHLAFDASADPVASLAARDDTETLAAMTIAARTALRGGVTTVRDLGDRSYLSLHLRGKAGLPTIVAAGPPITTPGGHCHFLGGAARPGTEGVRAAVRDHAERGVDVIKVMASGGIMTPGTWEDRAQFSAAELCAAVDEAHRHGLPVTAHAHGTQAIADAAAAGVDGLEHVSFWSADGVDTPPESLLRQIAGKGIVVGATAGFAPVAGEELDPATARRMPQIIANMIRLHQAGAPAVAGTDAGISPLKPHDVLRYAVAEFGWIGIGPAQALQAVTSVAAGVCGLAHRKGRLALGYDADILAVDGNPLSDPDAIHHIRAVYAAGVPTR